MSNKVEMNPLCCAYEIIQYVKYQDIELRYLTTQITFIGGQGWFEQTVVRPMLF